MTEKGKLWLFKNDYAKTDKHPLKTGNGEITKEVLDRLVAEMEKSPDGVIKIDCAAWINESKAGKKYEFVTFDVQDPQYAKGNGPAPPVDDDIPF